MIAIAAAVAAPRFAPPERTYRYVIERVIEGPMPQRFRIERRIRFARDKDGVVADIVLQRTEQMPPGPAADLFAKGQAPFLGRTLRAHYAPDGSVLAVDGAEAAFAAMVAKLDPRAAAPLLTLPPERRRAMVASIADALPAGADAVAAPGVQRVTLASALPGGKALQLTGTRTIARASTGRLILTVHAEGEGITLDRSRTVDPATGLVLEERESRAVTVDGITQKSRSTTTLSPTVS